MKKIFLLLASLLVMISFGFANPVELADITSIESSISQGLFENALDTASSVGEDFTSLDHNYLFSGLTNLEETTASGSWPFGDSSSFDLLWSGFYIAGDNPWSLFTGFNAVGATGNQNNGTTTTVGGSETVTIDSTNTTYSWDDSTIDTKYTRNRLFDELHLAGQYLFMFGDLNTGIYLKTDLVDNSIQTANYTQTTTNYYNSTAVDVIPVTQVDYTQTTTNQALDTDNTFTLSIPLYLQTGDSSHNLGLETSLQLINDSTNNTDILSGTPHSALAERTNTEIDETINKTTNLTFNAEDTYTMPALWGSHENNQLALSLNGGMTFSISESSTNSITQDVSSTGAGTAFVLGERSEDTETTDYKNGLRYNLNASANHSFFFDLGDMVQFGVNPKVLLSFYSNSPTLKQTETTVSKNDNNLDGDFADAEDRIRTTTTTYTNTNQTDGDAISTINIMTTILLPMSIVVSPEDWAFSVILGSTPYCQMNNQFITTKTAVNATKTSTVDGVGTAVGNTSVTNAETSDTTSTTQTYFYVGAVHNIGLSMAVGDFVDLTVDLGLSTSATNILDFKDFTIQAIIALP